MHDHGEERGERIQPLVKHEVKLISMGFLSPGDKPLVWRGPMLHSVIQQFLRGVDWGSLDYLLIDLPPGTGDVQLSLMQTTTVTGAVVVTTPSEVSLEDARKAVLMFQNVRVPVLGLVENMSYLIAPGSGERVDVFGHGGGERTANAMSVPFLGSLPPDPNFRIGGDRAFYVPALDYVHVPPPQSDPAGKGAPFVELAERVVERLAARGVGGGPTLTVSD
ncbi:MAG: hypothetical protein B7X34_02855 [Acidobacteriia bacterium 12-62-4]|nr:MAG: hypothetical protein B7X34_02855 [Acidobacteriia bacterium 12-62-4]